MPTILFCNIGWMLHYRGLTATDPITGGGSYIHEHQTGGEVHNFLPFGGQCYGYVQTVKASDIRIERLGAAADAAQLSGVTVVWTARHPSSGGTCVIGWYLNATVQRHYSELFSPPRRSSWDWQDREVGYYITAAATDVFLLPPDARTLAVPRGKGGMGQSNVWYADTEDAAPFIQQVHRFIKAYTSTGRPPAVRRSGSPRQPDTLKRIAVEQAAITCVWQHYTQLGYNLASVEKDNVGWDLEATADRLHLLLEVKGLSESQLEVELTPNEYSAFNNPGKRPRYRLCVVTQALTQPKLHVFSCDLASNQWLDEHHHVLTIQQIVGARMHL
ncbi:protein NO VEIN domain-containing protein [Hymenobacter pini]|uniref:protein NO VEIN domain-containing protein n=1 Tax=Hymenobacter pini TaxID=2880879 RepID=UPI001CF48005|nr:DUF3883 domain-containing protein [Hymenobacter pini]MCA8831903.1 DUF3883 domain-containing protein [Hymenobacter pini]